MATGSENRRGRGRPALPDEMGKRYSLGIRTTRELRDALKAVADLSGRSVAQEIELRLEQSFDTEKAYGGPRLAAAFRWLAALAASRSAEFGKDVFSDYGTAASILEDWYGALLIELMPRPPHKIAERLDKYRWWMRELTGDTWSIDHKRDIASALEHFDDDQSLPISFRKELRDWLVKNSYAWQSK
jgi:Arc-like DNA binding domain